jgi:nucleoside-diphosphate-sugar epimerase
MNFDPPKPRRVLITGATGLIGRAFVADAGPLLLRAAVRGGRLPAAAIDSVVVGEIGAQTDWSGALTGIDSVLHLAAHAHVMQPSAQDRRDFERVNVHGTERLARAACAAGVERFVYLSSIKVNGERTCGRPFRAGDMPAPADDYARSKWEAERRLAAIESTCAMRVSVVRSPLVYGPGVRANFLRLMSLARSAMPLPLASIGNSRSMVSTWNLVDLLRTLLCREPPSGGVILACDREALSTPELLRRLARLMGRPSRLFPMPAAALRVLGALTGRRGELRRLCDSLVIDASDTRARIGWEPPLSVDAGLERTVHWYLQHCP